MSSWPITTPASSDPTTMPRPKFPTLTRPTRKPIAMVRKIASSGLLRRAEITYWYIGAAPVLERTTQRRCVYPHRRIHALTLLAIEKIGAQQLKALGGLIAVDLLHIELAH